LQASRAIRIVLVSTYYRPVIGGAETSSERLALYLRRRGHHVEVITKRTAVDLPSREVIDGIDVHRLAPTGARSAAGKWLWLPWLFAALMRSQYDIICVNDQRGSGLAAWAAARLRRKALVIQPQTEGSLSGRHPAQSGVVAALNRAVTLPIRFVYGRADAISGISRSILDEARALGVEEARLHYMPNPFSASAFAPLDPQQRTAVRESLGWSPGDLVFLFTGRLSLEKGLKDLLTAWPGAAAPHWRLVLAGPAMPGHPWDLGAWIAGFVREHRLEQRVTTLGACTPERLARIMASADVAVLPSHFEAQGLAAVEAMACGLPIVATNVGGLPDFVVDGVNGLLVPPHDPRALGAALQKIDGILTHPDRRREWSMAARAAVLPFDQDAVLGRFAGVLEDLAAHGRRTTGPHGT
jgi:glycosyltransferase involved in cell wall biosynthesis